MTTIRTININLTYYPFGLLLGSITLRQFIAVYVKVYSFGYPYDPYIYPDKTYKLYPNINWNRPDIYKIQAMSIVFIYLNSTKTKTMNILKRVVLFLCFSASLNVFAQCDHKVYASPHPVDPLTYGFSYGAQSALNVLWEFGDDSTATFHGGTHTFAKAGTYIVCVTVDTCPKVCDTLTVGTAGINEVSAADFKMYPNPSSDNINFEFKLNAPQALQLQVISVMGSVVLETEIAGKSGANQTQLDISDLKKGMYTVQIIGVENRLYKTLLKL
ncbi:MAG: hypothetical protein ACI9JN_001850 [Bacteroidia bacterium]|jgi:hypothetical protein